MVAAVIFRTGIGEAGPVWSMESCGGSPGALLSLGFRDGTL